MSLPDGKATVGFEVCVKHVAAALSAVLLGLLLRAGRRSYNREP